MNELTREDKLSRFRELTKFNSVQTGREFADTFVKARLLANHPRAYREWNIIGQWTELASTSCS